MFTKNEKLVKRQTGQEKITKRIPSRGLQIQITHVKTQLLLSSMNMMKFTLSILQYNCWKQTYKRKFLEAASKFAISNRALQRNNSAVNYGLTGISTRCYQEKKQDIKIAFKKGNLHANSPFIGYAYLSMESNRENMEESILVNTGDRWALLFYVEQMKNEEARAKNKQSYKDRGMYLQTKNMLDILFCVKFYMCPCMNTLNSKVTSSKSGIYLL